MSVPNTGRSSVVDMGPLEMENRQGLSKVIGENDQLELTADLESAKTPAEARGIATGKDELTARYTDEHAIQLDAAEEKRIFWLINRRMLTYMLVTYCWETLDKNTISFAAVMGIQKDAHLTPIEYGWLTTIVYLMQFICQYPVNRLFQVLPVARTISVAVTFWGVVVAMTPLCNDFSGLLAVRALLGVFETAIQPGFTLLTSMWWRRGEQAQTIALWYSMGSFTGTFGGLLTYGCQHYVGGVMKNWQLMYLILGLCTVVWGATTLLWVPNSPMTAKCYSEADKKLMVERTRENQSSQRKEFKWEQAREALKDVHCCYLLNNLLVTLPSGGVGAYNGLITKNLGFTALQVELLSIPGGFWGMCCMFIGIMIYRKTRWTLGTAAMLVIPQLACIITMMTVIPTPKNKGGTLVALYLFSFLQPQVVIQLSLLTQNVTGSTKKSVAIAMAWCGSMIGNCIGPQVFSTSKPPLYRTGFTACLCTYSINLGVLTFLGFSYRRLNKRRDAIRAAERAGDTTQRLEDLDQAFDDLTDRTNPNFRYNF